MQEAIESIKSKISNSELKSGFNIEKLGEFFSNFMSGNEFLDNLDVKHHSEINRLQSNILNVKNNALIKNLITNSIKSKVINISNNEISFNKNSLFKLGDTNMVILLIIKIRYLKYKIFSNAWHYFDFLQLNVELSLKNVI